MDASSGGRLPAELPRDYLDPGSVDITQLLTDLQIVRTYLNRAVDLVPRVIIDDQNRRWLEAQVAVLKVRLMQLLGEL